MQNGTSMNQGHADCYLLGSKSGEALENGGNAVISPKGSRGGPVPERHRGGWHPACRRPQTLVDLRLAARMVATSGQSAFRLGVSPGVHPVIEWARSATSTSFASARHVKMSRPKRRRTGSGSGARRNSGSVMTRSRSGRNIGWISIVVSRRPTKTALDESTHGVPADLHPTGQ